MTLLLGQKGDGVEQVAQLRLSVLVGRQGFAGGRGRSALLPPASGFPNVAWGALFGFLNEGTGPPWSRFASGRLSPREQLVA